MDHTREEHQIAQPKGACLKVMGVGGGGSNAVNGMAISNDIEMVEFIIANTDAQALAMSPISKCIQLGNRITKGLGAGSNPEIGRRAAEEDIEEITKHIQDADIVFLTAGMGGGTGSGAAPVIAQVAKELGILTVGIVTKPFIFEGKRRMRHAEEAIEQLKKHVDTLLIVPNQKLLEIVDPKISMLEAFSLSNDILKQAVKGISDIITKPGHINVDFADVRTIMKDMGMALMGIGSMEGENRAREAAIKAISSPLLEEVSIEGARGVLINITGNTDLGLHEIHEAAQVVYDLVSEDANIILGSVIDPTMGNNVMVTVIATGFENEHEERGVPRERVRTSSLYSEPAVAYAKGTKSSIHEKRESAQVEDSTGSQQGQGAGMHTGWYKPHSTLFSMQDFDTPSFVRFEKKTSLSLSDEEDIFKKK